MYNFAITGVAGYVAPRHLKAVKDTNNNLVAAVDPHDSVGILDKYFPNASFFTEFERFDRHLEKLRRISRDEQVHYLSICSPNHLHDAHIRLALRIGANAICEKPLVINPWNLDALEELEEETNCRINTVLQLRVHPALIELKKTIQNKYKDHSANVKLTYITSRGLWYNYSWKGDMEKSGGVAANIGIHFFDMLIWLFGGVKNNIVHLYEKDRTAGFLELDKANIQWFLSIDKTDLPAGINSEETTFRSIEVDGEEINFSSGFTDLHTRIYEETIAGNGFGIKEARPSIMLVHEIRTAKISPISGNIHPFAKRYKN
ncbi:MAG: Gfo/Idh/MocA family oxidoreductase [Ignavibacteriaceae bacterium]